MRNKYVPMSLYDTYKSVAASMEDDKPKLFRQLDKHIDWDSLIPARFCLAFYRNIGRPRKYPLVAFLKSLVLQKIFGYVNDSVLLVTLRHNREMRRFCGFQKVPDAAKLTRFKQDFLPYIMNVFERLVAQTEPICREMDAELADCLIYDTTGVESYVAENNPKFFSSKLRQAKLMAKTNPRYWPISGGLWPAPLQHKFFPALSKSNFSIVSTAACGWSCGQKILFKSPTAGKSRGFSCGELHLCLQRDAGSPLLRKPSNHACLFVLTCI